MRIEQSTMEELEDYVVGAHRCDYFTRPQNSTLDTYWKDTAEEDERNQCPSSLASNLFSISKYE
jgi:hypothetical protein